jgi:hypothetical protein
VPLAGRSKSDNPGGLLGELIPALLSNAFHGAPPASTLTREVSPHLNASPLICSHLHSCMAYRPRSCAEPKAGFISAGLGCVRTAVNADYHLRQRQLWERHDRLVPSLDNAVSSIPPSAYEDDARIINLAGKAANVADELSASAISGENFKAAVTGDRLEGRNLYRSAMTFTPKALHLFTTNTLPRFSGGLDRGLQRRLVVVRFNRPIPENEIIPDIADRIRRDELHLLLGMAIAGAQRLMVNKGYTIPASSKEALVGWLRLEPVNEWFEERVVLTTNSPVGGWLRTSELFESFRSWALDAGHSERFLPPVNTFGQRLKLLPGVETRRSATGSLAIGIALRDVSVERPDFGGVRSEDW